MSTEEVFCWTWPLTTVRDPAPLMALLSEGERAKAASFAAIRHRSAYIVAHAGLRQVIARHLGRLPADLAFAAAPGGKPYLPDVLDCHFNLAHTEQYAVCAIGKSVVGVDIEHSLPKRDLLGIARQVATPRELAAMQALTGELLTTAFYRLWVRKEALLKANGKGLVGEPTLEHVGIETWSDAWQDLGPADAAERRWMGGDIPAPDHHVAAIVIAADAKRPPARHYQTLDL